VVFENKSHLFPVQLFIVSLILLFHSLNCAMPHILSIYSLLIICLMAFCLHRNLSISFADSSSSYRILIELILALFYAIYSLVRFFILVVLHYSLHTYHNLHQLLYNHFLVSILILTRNSVSHRLNLMLLSQIFDQSLLLFPIDKKMYNHSVQFIVFAWHKIYCYFLIHYFDLM
jgi:hypothetical protein